MHEPQATSLRRRRATRSTLAPLCAAALVGATDAHAASVKGKVTGAEKLLNPVWNEAKEPGANRYTWREPSATVKPDFRALYGFAPKELCLVALSDSPPATERAAPLALKIGGGRTTPVTLVVAPGTTLEFQNRDPFPHRPYVVGQGSFQVSEIKSSGTRQWQVPGPGVYEIRDELAPSLRSWVVVEPKLVGRAYAGRDGNFTFGNLPAGDYVVRAYFAGAPVGTPRQVKVGDKPVDLKDPVAVGDAPPAPKE